MKLRHPSVVMAWGLLAGPSAMVGMPMERADIDLGRAPAALPSHLRSFHHDEAVAGGSPGAAGRSIHS